MAAYPGAGRGAAPAHPPLGRRLAQPTHEGEPRGPFRPLRCLHEEDRPGGAARGAQETREEIREVELGHGPAEGHRKEGEPAPEETDEEEDLAARGAIGERSP